MRCSSALIFHFSDIIVNILLILHGASPIGRAQGSNFIRNEVFLWQIAASEDVNRFCFCSVNSDDQLVLEKKYHAALIRLVWEAVESIIWEVSDKLSNSLSNRRLSSGELHLSEVNSMTWMSVTA